MAESILLANYVMMGLAFAGWVLLAVAFLRRPRPAESTRRARRDPVSLLGIVLGVIGFALIWNVRRPLSVPPLGLPAPLHLFVVVLTASLVTIATWLSWGAFRTLGRQWSVQAMVRSGHTLIMDGPYQHVRHPIYASLGALLLTTGLALSRPLALLGGIVAYGVGTAIRVHREEELLRESFGEAYTEYARRVPAVLPRLWGE